MVEEVPEVGVVVLEGVKGGLFMFGCGGVWPGKQNSQGVERAEGLDRGGFDVFAEGGGEETHVRLVVRVRGGEKEVAVLRGFEALGSVDAGEGNGIGGEHGGAEVFVGLALPGGKGEGGFDEFTIVRGWLMMSSAGG
jgi:hypothetical protein